MSSTTDEELKATFLRMLGTDWPGGQSAVSGRPPLSTTCECPSTSCKSGVLMNYCPSAVCSVSIVVIAVVPFIRMGSFHAEPPPPKQRIERQRKAPSKEAKRIMPTQVANLDSPSLQLMMLYWKKVKCQIIKTI